MNHAHDGIFLNFNRHFKYSYLHNHMVIQPILLAATHPSPAIQDSNITQISAERQRF